MSVNTRIYIGVYIKLENYGIEIDPYDDKYEDMLCGVKGERFSIIHDGLGGEYTYFGITLCSFTDMYSFNKYIISPSDIVTYQSEIEERAKELFDIDDSKRIYPSCIVLSHSN